MVYLNPCNWAGFFALGILAGKLPRQVRDPARGLAVFAAVTAVCAAGLWRMELSTYFHPLSSLFSLGAGGLILCLSRKIADAPWADRLIFIGRHTYCIYLLHIQPVQAVCKRLPEGLGFDILRPFCGLAMMAAFVWVCGKMKNRFRVLRPVCSLIGL